MRGLAKRTQLYQSPGKGKFKSLWDRTIHPEEWLTWKRLTTPVVGADMEKRELKTTASKSVNRYDRSWENSMTEYVQTTLKAHLCAPTCVRECSWQVSACGTNWKQPSAHWQQKRQTHARLSTQGILHSNTSVDAHGESHRPMIVSAMPPNFLLSPLLFLSANLTTSHLPHLCHSWKKEPLLP